MKETYVSSTENLDDITRSITDHLKYDTQPSFDRLQSIDGQQEHVNYPPDPLPINISGDEIVYTRNIYDEPKQFPTLNSPKYDYDNVYGGGISRRL